MLNAVSILFTYLCCENKNTMKKLLLAIFVTASIATQAQAFKQGQVNINLGLGVGNTFIYTGATNILPLINLSGEYGITDDIGLGLFLGYSGATQTYNYGYNKSGGYYTYQDRYRWNFFIVGVRSAYHFNNLLKLSDTKLGDKVDIYAGLMLGYNIATYSYTSTDPGHPANSYSSSRYGGIAWNVFGGARFMFTEKVGVFGELGYGVSVFNGGLTFKIM